MKDIEIIVVVLIVALIIVGPLMTIWALNTLFPVLSIPYTLSTWAAALIVMGMFTKTNIKSKS